MNDNVKTAMAMGGFVLDVFLEAHASAEARQSGRPRQSRGPDFGEVLKKAGGSASLLDLRGTVGKFGGTDTLAPEAATEAAPSPSPPPTTPAAPTATRNLEAELAAVFAEADAARARLDETRRAAKLGDDVVELRQHVEGVAERLRQVLVELTALGARVSLLEAGRAPVAATPVTGADDVAPVSLVEAAGRAPVAVVTGADDVVAPVSLPEAAGRAPVAVVTGADDVVAPVSLPEAAGRPVAARPVAGADDVVAPVSFLEAAGRAPVAANSVATGADAANPVPPPGQASIDEGST
jgi:hypothetical protein